VRRIVLVVLVLSACEAEPPPSEPPAPAEPVEQGRPLGVPPQMIARARGEAAGLERLPPSLLARALERNREAGSPSYSALARDPSAHAEQHASFEGQLALVRPAGERLWIIALKTRRDGERWTDPVYVLSVVEPGVAEGSVARVDGWVVGPRAIGRNTLPLIVAYSIVS
jgi:hypothetical protein